METHESKMCNGVKMGQIGNRPFWVLNLSILIRALHQIGAAAFFATFFVGEVDRLPSEYLIVAFTSGAALFFTEWMRHRQIYRELSGVGTFIKLVLIGLAYHGLLPALVAVLLAFVIASVGAHAPKQMRHRLLF